MFMSMTGKLQLESRNHEKDNLLEQDDCAGTEEVRAWRAQWHAVSAFLGHAMDSAVSGSGAVPRSVVRELADVAWTSYLLVYVSVAL